MASNRGEERSTTNDNLNVSGEEVRPLLRKPSSLRASYSHDVYHLKPWDTTSQNHLLSNNSSPGLQVSQRHNGHSNTLPIPPRSNSRQPQPPPPHSAQPQPLPPHSTQPQPPPPHSAQPQPLPPHSTQPQPSPPHSTQPQPSPPHSAQPQQISSSLRHLKRILSHISIFGDKDHNVRPAKHVVLWLLLTFILFTVLAGVAAGNPTEAMRVSFGVFGAMTFVCLTGGVGWEIWKSSK
jgi:hypothetical protein